MEDKRFIIPFFISHYGCPHRCIYCDQYRITHSRSGIPNPMEITREVEQYLKVGVRKRSHTRMVQVAFYGGTCTSLPMKTQTILLQSINPFIRDGTIHSIRISTRPDAISPKIIQFLKAHGVATVELGVQSMNDDVLRAVKRGYTAGEVRRTVRELHRAGLEVGIQLMAGLPEDMPETFASTVEKVIEMRPHFVRIYPTLVIKGTVLEQWFHEGRYRPLSLEEAITLTKGALQRFRHVNIPVIRIGLQSTPSLEADGVIVAGPYHPAFRQLVESSILYDQAVDLLTKMGVARGSSPLFRLAPQDISTFYGQKGHTIKKIQETFRLRVVRVEADPQTRRGTVSLQW